MRVGEESWGWECGDEWSGRVCLLVVVVGWRFGVELFGLLWPVSGCVLA